MAVILFGVRCEAWSGASAACTTDNQTIAKMSQKGMTTKPLLAAAWAEVAALLTARNIDLDIQWAPREQNVEADDLTNEAYDRFDPALRIDIPSPFPWDP